MDDQQLVLDPAYEKIPLSALRYRARNKLSLYLDDESVTECSKGYLADFRGLSELIGFSLPEIRSFERQQMHTTALLNSWEKQPGATVGQLWNNLKILERYDVIDECQPIICKDCEDYIKARERDIQSPPEQVPEISTCTPTIVTEVSDMFFDEGQYMIRQDVEHGPGQNFDAFVCYNADNSEDLRFVRKLIEKLEDEKNLKLVVPYRDDLPGGSKYTTSTKLIQDRCKRVIIILSRSFLTSTMCDFQSKFAHALAPGARSKKLIPILLEQIPIPDFLRFVTICDFTKRDLLKWSWDRLVSAVKAPFNSKEVMITNEEILRSSLTLERSNSYFPDVSSSSISSLSSSPQPSTSSSAANVTVYDWSVSGVPSFSSSSPVVVENLRQVGSAVESQTSGATNSPQSHIPVTPKSRTQQFRRCPASPKPDQRPNRTAPIMAATNVEVKNRTDSDGFIFV